MMFIVQAELNRMETCSCWRMR